jgi:UDP-N-acetylglucosamine--N-acetylmuramyl-(pentapeptide) pyrophosphoryl-undecaprenol N-acetylglucosamine transferase
MSHFLISCGGTGGHLSPGIALAEGLTARGHTATLLISQKKVDARLIEKYPQLQFARMPGSGFSWRPIALMRCLLAQFRAVRFCRRLIRQTAPVGIVGFGGFTSAPIVLAGRWARLPVVLHESNRVPGLAIRWLGRLATLVYLPPGVRLARLQASSIRYAAPPVRREIVRTASVEARLALGLNPMRPVLVLLGGSQGARVLNNAVPRALAALGAGMPVQVRHQSGEKLHAEALQAYADAGVQASVEPFIADMAEAFAWADLVVCRSGASTLAELCAVGVGSVLVPFAAAVDDHQTRNAEYLVERGAAVLLKQDETLATQLEGVLRDLSENSARRMQMANAARALAKVDAAERIADIILEESK